MKRVILIALVLISSIGFSQKLELEEIMKGNEFIGVQPSNVTLLPFDKGFLFDWTEDKETLDKVFIYEYSTKAYRRVTVREGDEFPRYFIANEKQDEVYFTNNGTIFKWKKSDDFPKKIMETTKSIYNLNLIEKDTKLVFQEGNNLFAWSLKENSLKQLTNFVDKKSKKPVLSPMSQEQLDMFDYLNKKHERQQKRNKHEAKFQIEEFALNGRRLSYVSIDPTGHHLFFKLTEKANVEFTEMPKYVTQSGYTEMQRARPKVGREDAKQVLFYKFLKDQNPYKEVSLSGLSGIRKAPKYYEEYNRSLNLKEDRLVHIHEPIFSKDGKALFEFKSLDNKDRWLAIYDAGKLELNEVENQHDDKWIGGPGITGWNMVPGTIGWFDDSKRVYFQSEASGFSHLYEYDTKSKSSQQLTNGKFEIHEAFLSDDNDYFFITSNKSDAGNRSFYRFEVLTQEWSPILKEDGNYEVYVNPKESKLVYRYSTSTRPWEIFTADISGSRKERITLSHNLEFAKREWLKPEIIEFKAEDGTIVRARKYAPKTGEGNKAAVIFVHGAGYLQNAHNWWSGYYREYMFHNLLVEQGYTVLDIDYRASKGYGRDFRTDIYRHMGGKDLSDQLDGKKYLVEKCGISTDKVGIYGGSYGGFITLMALLNEPNEFACGAAIRSVTDWAHYNHEYTSNILNTPELDSVSYRRSGPIHFAKNLKDPLLMLHGLQDDNVQYQDIIRLSQRFIEAGVKDWELATYPIEPHGFKETSSWVDEYGRILKLFNDNLLDK